MTARDRPGCFTQYFWCIPRFIPESRNLQIMGLAAICWAIWKLRNMACFKHKLPRSPAEFVCDACSFMRYWVGLQTDVDRVMLEQGAAVLQRGELEAHDDGLGECRKEVQQLEARGADEEEDTNQNDGAAMEED